MSHGKWVSLAGLLHLGVLLAGCAQTGATLEMAAAAGDPQSSWTYLSEAAAEATTLVDEVAVDDLERREGYRVIARTLSLGFERFLEVADPAHPDFYRLQSAYRKFAGDNPDQLYHAAPVDGAHVYVVRGQLRAEGIRTVLIEVSVYGGNLSFEGTASRRLVGHLDERDLLVDADGGFEVIVGGPRREGNWIPLADDAQSLLVRRYFETPQLADPMPLSIQVVGGAAAVPELDQRALAKGLIGTGAFTRETVRVWGGWREGVVARHGVNVLRPLDDDGALLTPAGMHYLQGAWALAEDEALVLRFVPPDVPYWAFLPMNIWMESFDWRGAKAATLNGFNAKRDEDGRVTLVLSERDPGHANWIAAQGHRRGLMSMRVARLGEHPLPTVETTVVPVESLRQGSR